jgi:CRISPR system Cascade subunit CasD
MSTLLLRFASPLQSWGSSSRFQSRFTDREPSKSAVIGMIAASLGRRRNDSIDDLSSIGFGVRIDQPGKLLTDFQTAKTVNGKHAFISNRHYLSDAIFLVGIEDTDENLSIYESALTGPFFPLFLGRRSCPPTQPFVLGIREGLSLISALENEPWQASVSYMKSLRYQQQIALEIVVDTQFGTSSSYVQHDLPQTFSQNYRLYSPRSVRRIIDGSLVINEKAVLSSTSTEHDAIASLEVQ